ncbi:MAG: stage II sporulation protein D [Clostridia bacterium]|nr:stage II sporulation protein D [Clostridia bacterium]
MKKILIALLVFLVCVYALPVITLGAQPQQTSDTGDKKEQNGDTDYRSAMDIWNDTIRNMMDSAQKSDDDNSLSDEPEDYDEKTLLRVLIDGEVREMTVRDYLVGVVAAEMPAAFPIEALKAQAVAARSYMLHKIENSDPSSHPQGAQLCDDYTHCTAFFDIESGGRELWGDSCDYYAERIRAAVEDTDGVVAVYQGESIAAVFHSASDEMTEDAENIWGVKYSYLTPVKTSGGSASPNFYGTVVFSQSDFREMIADVYPSAAMDGHYSQWIGEIRRSQSGTVLGIVVGGVSIKGTEIRTLFGLNSANFNIEFKNGEVIFTTVGTGHGVGMSQYGAREMALNGSYFDEIIYHYYSGVQLMVKN